MEQRKKYRQEFKQEAVQLTQQAGRGITQVAKDLGLNAGMLGRWCREASRRGHKAFPGTGMSHDQELARLKRELALVTRERDFLQEAALSSMDECHTMSQRFAREGVAYGTMRTSWVIGRSESGSLEVLASRTLV